MKTLAEHDHGLANLDLVAVAQHAPLHLLAVQKRAIAALKIFNLHHAPLDAEARVPPRAFDIVDDEIAPDNSPQQQAIVHRHDAAVRTN
ncbi:hypothetical protein LBMAG49_07780 [Planctomycetota bacterium]|nr:hypothetical protein LBMAG49_07780 [Planctomycetota bacterium]